MRRLRGPVRRASSATGPILGVFRRDGAPLAVLAIVALLAIVAILVGIDTRRSHEIKGYAEFSATRTGCTIETSRSLNALRCVGIGDWVYSLRFSKSLENSTPIISRSTCCPGPATATVRETGDVLVYLGRPTVREVRASVIVP